MSQSDTQLTGHLSVKLATQAKLGKFRKSIFPIGVVVKKCRCVRSADE